MRKYEKYLRAAVFCFVLFAALILGKAVDARAEAELSKTYIILLLGQEGEDTYSLKVSGTDKGSELAFSVKDTAVASVDKNGKITALAPGKTTVVCTITDAKGKKTQKKATVRVYDNIKSITLSVKGAQPNALHKNETYAITYTCKTVAGTNKNVGNYIYYELLTAKGGIPAYAQIDADGNFTGKRSSSYTLCAYAFQSSANYQKWAQNREKYADYVLAQDTISLTVTTPDYKKTIREIGNFSVSLPEDCEVEIRENTKSRTAFSVQVKNPDGQNAVSNIQVMIDKMDEAQDYEGLASAMASVYTKEALEQTWQSAYNAKKASVKNLKIQKLEAGEREIIKLSYTLTLSNIVIKAKETADIKISRMDFVNTIYTWYDGKYHISVTVTDALESLQPNISEAGEGLVTELKVK